MFKITFKTSSGHPSKRIIIIIIIIIIMVMIINEISTSHSKL